MLEAYGLGMASFSLLKNYSTNRKQRTNWILPVTRSNSYVQFLKVLYLGPLIFNIFLYLTFDTKSVLTCFKINSAKANTVKFHIMILSNNGRPKILLTNSFKCYK